MDLASSIAESSQSIIPHSEVPEHKKGDEVEVHTLTRHNGRIYASVGRVSALILPALNMSDFMVVKLIAKFCKILHVTGRLCFQLIHNYYQRTRFRSPTDCLCCIVVKGIKIFFNLDTKIHG